MNQCLLFSTVLLLNGTMAVAQPILIQNQQLTSGVVGITAGQMARWNVLYPTAPAPILPPVCSVALNITDNQGRNLKTNTFSGFIAGKSVSLDLNADTELTGMLRTEIYASALAPAGCNFIATLELIDNITQKTVLVVGAKQTYPAARSSASASSTRLVIALDASGTPPLENWARVMAKGDR